MFGLIDTRSVKFLNAIEAKKYSASKTPLLNYTPCDAILAAIILKPDMVRNIIPCSIDIELRGELRGRTVLSDKDLLLFAADPNKYSRNLL